jgi:predicted XRE-type DNA-binding protein
LSQLRILTAELGQLPTKALERPEAIEDFKARCSERAIATTNRYLPPRGNAKLTWGIVQKIRARAQSNVSQGELASTFKIPQSRCSEIVSGEIWNSDAKLTTGDEMRDRIIGALDTGCRSGDAEDPEQARGLGTSLDSNPQRELKGGGRASYPV